MQNKTKRLKSQWDSLTWGLLSNHTVLSQLEQQLLYTHLHKQLMIVIQSGSATSFYWNSHNCCWNSKSATRESSTAHLTPPRRFTELLTDPDHYHLPTVTACGTSHNYRPQSESQSKATHPPIHNPNLGMIERCPFKKITCGAELWGGNFHFLFQI